MQGLLVPGARIGGRRGTSFCLVVVALDGLWIPMKGFTVGMRLLAW
jgi:hypothetical protein